MRELPVIVEWPVTILEQKVADQTSVELQAFRPPSMYQQEDEKEQHTDPSNQFKFKMPAGKRKKEMIMAKIQIRNIKHILTLDNKCVCPPV